MKLLAIALFSEHFVNAIGTTLLHSLWQGLILVGVIGLIILSTRSRKSSFRYNLLISSLVAFFFVNLITFVNAYSKNIQPSRVDFISNGKGNLTLLIPEVNLFTNVTNYLSDHNETVVLMWLLIVAARCFQLVIGLNGLSFLRRNAKFTVSAEWETKVKDLAQQLGIKAAVHIAECTLIRVPMVIGHLKPLILLPLGMLTALPPKEIEAILVHELAHIYRRDYLVNILQSVMEILFFFNPAVLWLSALIKTERENCCDDIAVSETNSKINYISALIACQEYQQSVPAYAMAFGKKGHLRNRVSRLVDNNNRSLNSFEKSVFIFCTVAASLVLFAFANEAKIEKIVSQTTTNIETAFVITQEKSNLNTNSLTQPKSVSKLASKLKVLSTQDSISTNHKEIWKLDSIRQRLAKENEIIHDSLKALSNKQKINVEHSRLDRLKSTLAPLSRINSGPNYKTKPTLADRVKEELIIDGIIVKSQSQTSFMLSAKEMIVNGKRQPQEVYQKYKEKYVPALSSNGWILYYHYDTSENVSIS